MNINRKIIAGVAAATIIIGGGLGVKTLSTTTTNKVYACVSTAGVVRSTYMRQNVIPTCGTASDHIISYDATNYVPPAPTTTTVAPTTTTLPPTTTTVVPTAGTPLTPPALICGNHGILDGPSIAPAGAVSVPAGDNSTNFLYETAGTTYWLAPGVHTLGTGIYNQIIPANNTTFIGAPGAILDGQGVNNFAFTSRAIGVTIKYLTVQNFTGADPNGGGSDQGVVNHDSGDNWTVINNTIQNNHGAGIMIGSNNNISYNCLTNNGQYGFNAYEPVGTDQGPVNILMDHNEISYNDKDLIQTKPTANGNYGGGKFWQTTDATVTNNYVHDNFFTGLWFDSDNTGALIQGNYISANANIGLWYEVSYNALIKNNNFVKNDIVGGPANDGFPGGAIYISESGGDSRVKRGIRGYSTIDISSNIFTDNWSGISLWENSDRFCGNGEAGYCTLVNPTVANISTCIQANIATTPYIDDCRWKTQNITVHNNIFSVNKTNVGNGCATANSCGLQAIFSQYGTYPSWSPYKGWYISDQIVSSRNIYFSNNSYHGPWAFIVHDTGTKITLAQWLASPYNQDVGSTFGP
jgi:hypothetical protein